MAAGYALGALLERQDRRRWILRLGVALTLAFFALRTVNLYGNGVAGVSSFSSSSVGPWKLQPSLTLTVIAFFNTLKYPPSLDYLLMTLGPALIVLACLDGVTAERGLGRILLCSGGCRCFTAYSMSFWFTLWRFLWASYFINPSLGSGMGVLFCKIGRPVMATVCRSST
jgi:uncharacterized membrane protein